MTTATLLPENRLPLIGFGLVLAIGGALLVTQAGPALGVGTTLIAALMLLSFLNTEFALHLMLVSMLLSPEIAIGGSGGLVAIGKVQEKGDVLVLRLEDLILVAASLAWLARVSVFRHLPLVRKNRLTLPIVVYSGVAVLATILGVSAGKVRPLPGFFFCLKYIEFFFVYFMTVNFLRNAQQLRRLLRTMIGTCLVACVLGIAQIPQGLRPSAPFEGSVGEPNTLGGYLVLMFALTLGCGLTTTVRRHRWGWLALAGLILLPLLFTLSRTSWMAAIPMLGVLILLSPKRHFLLIAILLAALGGAAIVPDAVIERWNYTFNSPEDRGDFAIAGATLDTSTSARVESWHVGFFGWLERPLFGYGVRGFAFMDANYFRVLVESGLFGLAAFLWLLVRTGRTAWATYQQVYRGRYEGLALGYLAGFVAMVTHGIGANTYIIVRIMEPYWFLTGIMVLLPTLDGIGSVPATQGSTPVGANP